MSSMHNFSQSCMFKVPEVCTTGVAFHMFPIQVRIGFEDNHGLPAGTALESNEVCGPTTLSYTNINQWYAEHGPYELYFNCHLWKLITGRICTVQRLTKQFMTGRQMEENVLSIDEVDIMASKYSLTGKQCPKFSNKKFSVFFR